MIDFQSFNRWQPCRLFTLHSSSCDQFQFSYPNLGLRVHAAGIPNYDDSRRLRHNRLYLLPVERRRLPMAMDQFSISCLNSHLRVYLFLLLLLLQNKVSVVGAILSFKTFELREENKIFWFLIFFLIFSPECTDYSKRHFTSATWHCLAVHLV